MVKKQSNQPEDIFEEVDKTPKRRTRAARPAVSAQPNMPQQPAQPIQTQSTSSISKRVKLLLIVLAPLILISIAAVLVSSGVFNVDSNNDDPVVNTTPEVVVNSETAVNTNPIIEDTIEVPTVNTETADSDGDGLTDEEEKTYGTNALQADSDGDGLFDYEEVMVYKTKPNMIDTDGDGHTDGDEVADGYDPNGPGLLLDINAAVDILP